ncbi:MAG: Ig-like domain-containing protein [Fibrobacterota bacterium]|nr:Ig-like domain-containing protein [Fibrobacterota bacterium]
MHPNKSFGSGGSSHARGARFLGKTLVVAASALSIAFVGCSQKAGKSTPKVVGPVNQEEPIKIVSKLDSLVKLNSGVGKGIITGFLTGESKSIAKGLLKTATNAGGERRLLTKSEIPLTGATILIFDALKPTTSADTTLKTDTAGNYTGVLKEGKYFGFAVYLDLETFQLVTTSIPNMNPKADSIVRMDTAIAIEDVTAPTVAGVYDANVSNDDAIFLVGSLPDKNAKINITFSEPINRESAKGVILGKIDTSNTSTSMVLADTVKDAKLSWSGDSKELTVSVPALTLGAQYGLIMPTTLKDLAKNPLEKEYKATFVTIAAAELAAIKFAVVASFPAHNETMKPIQNPGVSFNRPVEVFSVLKGAKIEPAVNGYWEISGARAVFIHKEPLSVGTKYTVTLPTTVADLAGAGLTAAHSYSFTVKDFEGAAKDNLGREKEVALAVETAFDAYLSGDVGRFAIAFHQNFRLYGESGDIRSKTQFLDMIRADVGERQAMSAGFAGPVFDNSTDVCKENVARWKVAAEGGGSEIWVDAYVNPGQSPRAYDADKKEIISTNLTWDPTGPRFTVKATGKKYGFGPDMSKFRGPVNMDAAKGDMRFMADMLKQTSTVVLEAVKLEGKEEFKVDASVSITGDTAKLAVKMIQYQKFNRINFGDINQACEGKLIDTSFQVLKFVLVHDGSRWMITSIVEPARIENRADFDKAIDSRNFEVKQIHPVTLVSPLRDNAQGADGKVTFKFKGPVHDSIGGYLVGIAEDPKFCFGRPPYGALIFVKASNKTGAEETLVLNGSGLSEGTNAASILRRVQDLRLPGWERTMFENALTTLYKSESGFGGVYNWKVIAIKDTSAVQFLANGFNPARFYAESDFGLTRGYFACKNFPQGAAFATLETNQQNFVNTQPMMNNGFSDMDQDGVPDGIEGKYKTDPRDRNSFPNFRIDTDGDGLADFLEALLDKSGAESLVTKKADAAGVKSEIAALIALGIIWQDSDSDGFPNDIEMMAGFNPMDPNNNPGTSVRASAPIGVFTGKFQMGSQTNTISFKLYTDSAKALMVRYTAVIGRDTLVDSLKTVFNEGAGEVFIPVILPMNGPDAGRALLLRGHFDAMASILMGPVDMITAPVKGSLNFGSGPYVGQFAASGRGEDVSRYLPGNTGGMSGPIVNNPINTMPMGISYRLPPTGTDTGASIVFGAKMVTLVDAFGDTLAVIDNLMFRTQPDGTYEFNGQKRTDGANGTWLRSEVGGRIMYDGKGSYVVAGHFFQESDSAGIHKSFPGQFNARALKAAMTPSPEGIAGTMIGWIAQDKTGSGFAAQPTNPMPCDPMKGPCPQPVCNPMMGPCPQPVCDPAKGPCGPTGTVNSFARPFMAGTETFERYLMKAMVEPGSYFHVSMNGQVFRVKYDSTHLYDAKAPMCGNVAFTLEAIPAKSDSAHHLAAFTRDGDFLKSMPANNLIIAIEDQFMGATPAHMDKARDAQGEIRSNVFVVESRPTPMDYGTSTIICRTGTIVTNPVPCDPMKGPCPQPICDPMKGPCSQPICDPMKGPCPQPVCDPMVTTCPQPRDMGPPFYKGSPDMVKQALTASNNMVGIVKDSIGTISAKIAVNGGSIFVDQVTFMVILSDAGGQKYIVLSAPGEPMKMAFRDGVPLVYPKPMDGGTTPIDPNKPVVTNPEHPPFYKGTVENLRGLLDRTGFEVRVMGPVPYLANIKIETLISDGTVTTVLDANNAKMYIFMGMKDDAFKPAISPDGTVMVMEKMTTAGP